MSSSNNNRQMAQSYKNADNKDPRTNGQGHYYQHDNVNDGEKNFAYHTYVRDENTEADLKISGFIKLGDGAQINIGTQGNSSNNGSRRT
jgi:hypothetical protein